MNPLSDIDAGFSGMDMRLDPSHLPPGTVAYAQNARFSDGVAKQRPGLMCMNWGLTSYEDGEVVVDPFIEPKAAGIFRDPNNVEIVLVAAGDKVYRFHPNNTPEEMPLPEGETLGDDVSFVQAFDSVVMFRGTEKRPLVLTGENLSFSSIDIEPNDVSGEGTENPSDGTEAIPNSTQGVYISNRLVTIHGRDQVAVSDYLNYTRYDPVRGVFRINQGSEDRLVGLSHIDQNTIVFFKERSVYVVRNVYGDLSNARLDELTRSYGCIAANTIAKVGTDVVFLSRRGLCSLAVTEQGMVQAVDEPLSKPIQPIIDSIDWQNVDQARTIYHNNRIYLAVPLAYRQQYGALRESIVSQSQSEIQVNGETVVFRQGDAFNGFNNCVLVYDLLTKQWASVDTGAEVSVKDFFVAQYNRASRLFFIANSGWIHMYDDESYGGPEDQVRSFSGNVYSNQNQPEPIDFKILTRGYLGANPSRKRFHKSEMNFRQQDASLGVILIGDTPNDRTEMMTSKTFSRTDYFRPFDAEPYDLTNVNDDHGTDGRGDYTMKVSDDFSVGQNGISFGLKQYYSDRKPCRLRGTRLQAEITNSSGEVSIHSFGIHASVDDNKTTGKI